MKKICLVVVGLYLSLLSVFSQSKDSTQYKSRKLKIDEINFVSSYYHQDGNNSAITGGIGTERLTDYANNFGIKLKKINRHQNKVGIDVNLGIDYYTSASSDKIDLSANSSASARDLRIYPSISRTVTNDNKRNAVTTEASFSNESDYVSVGLGLLYSKRSRDNNREFVAKGQLYIDDVKIILPVEFRTTATGGLSGAPNEHDYPWKSRNTFSTSFTLSQVANQRLQLMWLLDIAYQHGFLGLPFHRVYFNTGQLATENLPSSRFKLPVAMRANYFWGDKVVVRSFYRFYVDDWGITAHTIDMEIPVKLTPFFSISPFYRYYYQNGANYFAAYQKHIAAEKYYTSNYDLSTFDSHFLGTGFRWTAAKGLFGQKHWSMLEFRYGHYLRSDGLSADNISLQLQFK